MDIRVTSLRGVPLLELEGDIDHSNCAAVETALGELLDGGNNHILLDLTDVTYIDSGGICILFHGTRQVRGKGWLGVVGPNRNVRRLLEIVGLYIDPSFRAFEDRPAAEIALSEGAA